MRCLVVGSPIAHSLSPAMHRAAYRVHGLGWSYDRLEVGAGHLSSVVDDLGDQVVGLSVTAPLKSEAAALAAKLTEPARELQIANTLVRDDSGGWSAANTDIDGIRSALAEAGVQQLTRIRILGAGATAMAAAYAVAQPGVRTIDVVVRDRRRARSVAAMAARNGADVTVSSLADRPRENVDLLISTVPVAATTESADAWASASGVVFDVVYDPWPTALATAALQANRVVVSGLDLLAHQAAEQLALMAGLDVDPAMLRDAALEDLNGSVG